MWYVMVSNVIVRLILFCTVEINVHFEYLISMGPLKDFACGGDLNICVNNR